MSPFHTPEPGSWLCLMWSVLGAIAYVCFLALHALAGGVVIRSQKIGESYFVMLRDGAPEWTETSAILYWKDKYDLYIYSFLVIYIVIWVVFSLKKPNNAKNR